MVLKEDHPLLILPELIISIKIPKETKTNFFLHYGDLTDATNLIRLLKEIKPTEIYNLAAQSHVHVSFETPEYTANADALGTLRIFEGIRILGLEKILNFTKPLPQSYTEKFQISYKTKKLLFIHVALMELQNFIPIGLLKIIGRPIIFLHLMEFCLIMKVQ